MTTMKDKNTRERYFIVERVSLSSYGSESGSTKEEAEQLLEEAGEVDNLVVIKGELVQPKYVL